MIERAPVRTEAWWVVLLMLAVVPAAGAREPEKNAVAQTLRRILTPSDWEAGVLELSRFQDHDALGLAILRLQVHEQNVFGLMRELSARGVQEGSATAEGRAQVAALLDEVGAVELYGERLHDRAAPLDADACAALREEIERTWLRRTALLRTLELHFSCVPAEIGRSGGLNAYVFAVSAGHVAKPGNRAWGSRFLVGCLLFNTGTRVVSVSAEGARYRTVEEGDEETVPVTDQPPLYGLGWTPGAQSLQIAPGRVAVLSVTGDRVDPEHDAGRKHHVRLHLRVGQEPLVVVSAQAESPGAFSEVAAAVAAIRAPADLIPGLRALADVTQSVDALERQATLLHYRNGNVRCLQLFSRNLAESPPDSAARRRIDSLLDGRSAFFLSGEPDRLVTSFQGVDAGAVREEVERTWLKYAAVEVVRRLKGQGGRMPGVERSGLVAVPFAASIGRTEQEPSGNPVTAVPFGVRLVLANAGPAPVSVRLRDGALRFGGRSCPVSFAQFDDYLHLPDMVPRITESVRLDPGRAWVFNLAGEVGVAEVQSLSIGQEVVLNLRLLVDGAEWGVDTARLAWFE